LDIGEGLSSCLIFLIGERILGVAFCCFFLISLEVDAGRGYFVFLEIDFSFLFFCFIYFSKLESLSKIYAKLSL
jgi:hypothetical protein